MPGKNAQTIIRQRQRLSISVGGGRNHTHTHTSTRREGQWPRGLRSTHLLSASVPHFNNLSLCKLYKEITACTLSASKPLAHLSQPLHIPTHLLLLSIPLYSPLCATLTWHLSPELSDTTRPVERSGGWGVQLAWSKRFDLNQMADHIRLLYSRPLR